MLSTYEWLNIDIKVRNQGRERMCVLVICVWRDKGHITSVSSSAIQSQSSESTIPESTIELSIIFYLFADSIYEENFDLSSHDV